MQALIRQKALAAWINRSEAAIRRLPGFRLRLRWSWVERSHENVSLHTRNDTLLSHHVTTESTFDALSGTFCLVAKTFPWGNTSLLVEYREIDSAKAYCLHSFRLS
jgi:hypothetical protein